MARVIPPPQGPVRGDQPLQGGHPTSRVFSRICLARASSSTNAVNPCIAVDWMCLSSLRCLCPGPVCNSQSTGCLPGVPGSPWSPSLKCGGCHTWAHDDYLQAASCGPGVYGVAIESPLRSRPRTFSAFGWQPRCCSSGRETSSRSFRFKLRGAYNRMGPPLCQLKLRAESVIAAQCQATHDPGGGAGPPANWVPGR